MLNNSQLYARVGRRQFKVQSLGQVSAAYRDLLTKVNYRRLKATASESI